MRLDDFDYPLPKELVAQFPAERRDASRLMVVPPAGEPLRHATFRDLPSLLPSGALVVVNDSRVIPARLIAEKPTGGRVELLLVEPLEARGDGQGAAEIWRCLARAKKPFRPGTPMTILPPIGRGRPSGPAPRAVFLGRDPDGAGRVELCSDSPGGILAALEHWGEIPLPPYIHREHGSTREDHERYQTLFARAPGAVAAPTAGLHFTPEVLAALSDRGIHVAHVTLHVGPGTFAPIRDDDIEKHVMHVERYCIPAETAHAHKRARDEGRIVVAVGTTVVRTLESAWDDSANALRPGAGSTQIFLKPGHRFRTIDRLITNFHLPRSTLLLLVSALAGRERVLEAYVEAVAKEYRFFSYGDAMLLYPGRGAP
ncbi:MAG: tRNA preQ1(34) S-adenosylmethionine ribosyltransferase-isomerase QueA [Deltaproteobacteria bacterium]|nr:tRNA preQ1(34) S-adenosylmethionine ribosyltransferase-isomerase QueA [Deltaproteobacteria bacterium]